MTIDRKTAAMIMAIDARLAELHARGDEELDIARENRETLRGNAEILRQLRDLLLTTIRPATTSADGGIPAVTMTSRAEATPTARESERTHDAISEILAQISPLLPHLKINICGIRRENIASLISGNERSIRDIATRKGFMGEEQLDALFAKVFLERLRSEEARKARIAEKLRDLPTVPPKDKDGKGGRGDE